MMTMQTHNGEQLDATLSIKESGKVVFHARSKGLNEQYAQGLKLLLDNLAKLNATITDVSICSGPALRDYSDEHRVVKLQTHRYFGPVESFRERGYYRDGEVHGYPQVLREVPCLELLRKSIQRGQRYAATRKPCRNTTRRILISFDCRIKDPVKLFARLGGVTLKTRTHRP